MQTSNSQAAKKRHPASASPEIQTETIIRTENLTVHYGKVLALQDVSMEIPKNRITAFIGPSGCGKSTLIRCFNRLNDLIDECKVEGKVVFQGKDLYGDNIDPVKVRRQIGMVFQKPNPFPKSIYENIAYGARIIGHQGDMDELVERSLQRAALWEEVKDKLKENGTSLSGGQQQRLCIARAIALTPKLVLMDEPCSSLDPLSTSRIEDLIQELREEYSIIIVTHNMQQATRVSDYTAFFNAEESDQGNRYGYLVEYQPTEEIFSHPQEEATQAYVSGQFG